jgi:hypothetical protein
MAEDVAVDLPTFVKLTERLVDQIVKHAESLLPKELVDPSQKAWADLERRERALVAEARDLPNVTLMKVGLSTGPQLDFKLAAYNHILGTFRKSKGMACLSRLLTITDDILAALVEVLTVAEPLRVMVQSLQSSIDAAHCESEGDPDAQATPFPEDFQV